MGCTLEVASGRRMPNIKTGLPKKKCVSCTRNTLFFVQPIFEDGRQASLILRAGLAHGSAKKYERSQTEPNGLFCEKGPSLSGPINFLSGPAWLGMACESRWGWLIFMQHN